MRLILALYLIMMSLASTEALASYGTDYDPQAPGLSVEAQLDQYLFRAAREGDLAVLKAMVEAGQSVNRQDDKGYTPLTLAAYHGHAEAVELLLRHGADPGITDKRGNTALFGAIFKGELSIAKRLLAVQKNADQANRNGQTPVMYAALFDRKELLAELQKRGADFDREDVFGNSARTLATGDIHTMR